MRRVLSAAITAAMLSLSTAAVAQAPSAEDIKAAGAEFDLGRRAYKSKEYGEAAEHFTAADGHAPSAAALELAIRSRDRQGKLDRAATLAALALARHPDKADLQKMSEKIIKKATEELHRLTVRCDVKCDVVVNTRLIHGGPRAERDVFLAPGDYKVRAGWTLDRTETKQATAEVGGSSELTFTQPPEPLKEEDEDEDEDEDEPRAAAPPATPVDTGPTEPPSGWHPAVFWVGLVATAGIGGATIWSGVDTKNNPGKARVRAECIDDQGRPVFTPPTDCPAYRDGKDAEARTNILIGATAGVGALTVLVGAFLTNWQGDGDKAAKAARPKTAKRGVEPWIGVGNGALVGATGRF